MHFTWYLHSLQTSEDTEADPNETPDTCVPEERKTGFVYEVPSKECSKTHVGETKRTLKVRLGEHNKLQREAIPKMELQSTHAHKTQHEIDWNGAQMKKMGVNYWKRSTHH